MMRSSQPAFATTDTTATLLPLGARLDSLTGQILSYDAQDLLNSGQRDIVLECQELTHISNAGIRTILDLARLMHNQGGQLMMTRPQPQVYAVLKLCGVMQWVTLVDGPVSAAYRDAA